MILVSILVSGGTAALSGDCYGNRRARTIRPHQRKGSGSPEAFGITIGWLLCRHWYVAVAEVSAPALNGIDGSVRRYPGWERTA